MGLVNGYNLAIETINKQQQDSPSFKAFLEVMIFLFLFFFQFPDPKRVFNFLQECRAKPECRMIGIAEHLLTPIQRIPRYVLLLADLLKNTDSEHCDYDNLVRALDEMKKTADFINEMKRKADSRLRVVEILEEVTAIPEDLVLSSQKSPSPPPVVNIRSCTTAGLGGTSSDVPVGA